MAERPTLFHSSCCAEPSRERDIGVVALPSRSSAGLGKLGGAVNRGVRRRRQADRAAHLSRQTGTSADILGLALFRATSGIAGSWRPPSGVGSCRRSAGNTDRRRRRGAQPERCCNITARAGIVVNALGRALTPASGGAPPRHRRKAGRHETLPAANHPVLSKSLP